MIDNLEDTFLEYIAHFISMKGAIVFEDLLMTALAILCGFILGQLRAIFLYRKNFRINDKMRHLVFQRNEYNGIVEYDFKHPYTFVERVEALIGLHMAGMNYSKLELSKARRLAFIAIAILVIIILSLVIAIAFAFHVTHHVIVK